MHAKAFVDAKHAFLTKMMIADPYALRESVVAEGGDSWLKKAVVYPSSLLPSWQVTTAASACAGGRPPRWCG